MDETSISKLNDTELHYKKKRGLESNFRLGCQTKIFRDAIFDIPPESQLHKQIIRKSSQKKLISLAPAVKLFYVDVEKPDINKPNGDF